MELESKEFTVYSIKKCGGCIALKKLLEEKKLIHTIIYCDDFINEDREGFREFMNKISNNNEENMKTFPIVFYDEKFIGSLKETILFIRKMLFTFDENTKF